MIFLRFQIVLFDLQLAFSALDAVKHNAIDVRKRHIYIAMMDRSFNVISSASYFCSRRPAVLLKPDTGKISRPRKKLERMFPLIKYCHFCSQSLMASFRDVACI